MTERVATGHVERIIDGDTLVLDHLDVGWGLRAGTGDDRKLEGRIRQIRAAEVDTWERSDPLGPEATAYTAGLFPVGVKVSVLSYGMDGLGRTVAHLVRDDGLDWTNALLARPDLLKGRPTIAAQLARRG